MQPTALGLGEIPLQDKRYATTSRSERTNTVQQLPTINLTDRAMLVDLTIRKWTASARDKAVSAEVVASHSAEADSGHFYKHLMPKESMAKITRIVSGAYASHRYLTVPFMEGTMGSRLLMAVGFQNYQDTMRKWETEWDAAIAEFAAEYPRLLRQAPTKLGSMFNAADYPAPATITDEFSFGFRVAPVPATNHLATLANQLGQDEVNRLGRALQEEMNRSVEAMVVNVADRIKEVVGRMYDKLTATRDDGHTPAIFRDSLVENIRDLVTILPSLNVTNHPTITELTHRLSKLAAVSPNTLRDNQRVREATAKEARNIAKEADKITAQVGDFI